MTPDPDAGPYARRPPSPGGARRRRRLGPGGLRWFLAVSGVLARVFDAAAFLRRARRGPWRAEVAEGSMAPALLPGDWLLLDPTTRRWPRPGTIVVVREPDSGLLAIKRVVARGPEPVPGDPGRHLGRREAWVRGDAAEGSIDSRAYGPLDADDLVGRAWLRYGPLPRIGRLR